MVASEVHPFAKTGGLADVLGALPRALAKLGHQVDVVMPRYRGVSGGSSIGQIMKSLGFTFLRNGETARAIASSVRNATLNGPCLLR